jgi:hypothetical protein
VRPALTDPLPDEAFGQWLDFWKPLIQRIAVYRWKDADINHLWHFLLRRAIIVRQFEGLGAMRTLIGAGNGNFGVLFLRPAFEELVWIEYLQKYPDIANKLLLRLTHHEVGKSIAAQLQYAGAKEMIEGGFTKTMVAGFLMADAVGRREIREIGNSLGWKTGKRVLPSMSYLSEQVGRSDEYKFLYHGTSRYVHFSTQELLRRVWGVQGEVTISSSTFRDYWQRFGMSWGARMFLDLLIVCVDDFDEIIDGQLVPKLQEAQKLLQFFGGKIPIITADELKGWPQRELDHGGP